MRIKHGLSFYLVCLLTVLLSTLLISCSYTNIGSNVPSHNIGYPLDEKEQVLQKPECEPSRHTFTDGYEYPRSYPESTVPDQY